MLDGALKYAPTSVCYYVHMSAMPTSQGRVIFLHNSKLALSKINIRM